jgi:NAD(P)-dependent dehydrogenase (short-subunit alcohol dehydrogenase family)
MSSAKVAIILAASRGIGAGCAKELAARGYNVSLMARSPEVLNLAAELQGIAIQGSMTNPQDLQRLVETTLAKFGRPATYSELAKTVAFLISDEAYSAAI